MNETVEFSDYEANKINDGFSTGQLENAIYLKGSVRYALNHLSDDHREILLQRFADEMRFCEIADVSGKSLEATKSMFRRSIAALREELDKNYEPEL